jgi:hypothetical protein
VDAFEREDITVQLGARPGGPARGVAP